MEQSLVAVVLVVAAAPTSVSHMEVASEKQHLTD